MQDLKYMERIFKRAGFEVRLVGGAVRDIQLGKEPKDIDLATDATPEEMMEVFRQNSIKWIETGLQHGTITALVDSEPYEITTLRVDKETDGRWAEVEFTRNWKEDARRRDFTINAMSMTPDGELFDYFGGQEDLKNGVVKFVGDPDMRIQEDYLRILRFFRFRARLAGFSIDPDAYKADKEQLEAIERNKEGLKGISGERIWQEMSKILPYYQTSNDQLPTMEDTGVLNVIGMNWSNMASVKTKDPAVILALFAGNEDNVDWFFNNWRGITRQEKDKMKFILRNFKPTGCEKEKIAEAFFDPKIGSDWAVELANVFNVNIEGEFSWWNTLNFPVSGEDLMREGFTAGPELGRILKYLKKLWIYSVLDKNPLSRESLIWEAKDMFNAA